MKSTSRRQKTLIDRKAKVAKKLPKPTETVRGTLVERYQECGKPNCRCHKGSPHGPYFYLVTTLAPGKTRTILVPPEEVPHVRKWVANFKRFKGGMERITEINTELLRLSRLGHSHKEKSR